MERDRTPLRKTTEDDSIRGYSAVDFSGYELADGSIRVAESGLVFNCRTIEREDVVPRPHGHAAIDRDGTHGRVWEREAPRTLCAPNDFGHHGNEVIPIGAEAVEPNHGSIRSRRGFDLYGFEEHALSIQGPVREVDGVNEPQPVAAGPQRVAAVTGCRLAIDTSCIFMQNAREFMHQVLM